VFFSSSFKHFLFQELPIDEPCSCICLADSFVIVGTDKFYKINLDHPTMTGMLLLFLSDLLVSKRICYSFPL